MLAFKKNGEMHNPDWLFLLCLTANGMKQTNRRVHLTLGVAKYRKDDVLTHYEHYYGVITVQIISTRIIISATYIHML